MTAYVIIALIVLLIISYIFFGFYEKNKTLKGFRSKYINWDNIDYDFERLKIIRRYWDKKNQVDNAKHFIDDITWSDLDMDYLYMNMNVCQSSIGEEYLYAKLREISFDKKSLDEFEQAMDFFDNNIEIKAKTLYELKCLGKSLHNNLHSYIYHIEGKKLKNAKMFYVFAALPILIIFACFYNINFIVALLLALGLNLYVYYKNKFDLEMSLNNLSYISKLTYCAEKLWNSDFGELKYSKMLKDNLKPLKKLNRLSNSLTRRASTDLEMLLEYVKILFMWDFINYNRIIGILSKHIGEFHELYKAIGEIDCAIAVNEYRKHLDYYSAPQFTDEGNIECEEIYHPLIDAPVSNSFNWKNNSIITGSNASGKSTFIKALAISGICAQSLNLCFAKSYKTKMSCVITSMAVKDNVYQGESYFIAEIKSLKRIADNLNSEIRYICFIDEILRGTNTVERIAASASMLKWLDKKNCLIMVASHDIELKEILKAHYENYHFREQVTQEGLFFDYKIKDGHAKTKNAIKLLEHIGFDNEILIDANDLVNDFESSKIWKSL